MQNFLTEYINNCKSKYENLWDKLYTINQNSEADYNNFILLKNSLPQNLNEADKFEIRRLLDNVDIKLKQYNNEIFVFQKQFDEFSVDTQTYIKNLDNNPNVKGNLILSKNTLIQNFNEYYQYLKDGQNQVLYVLENLKSMFSFFKQLVYDDLPIESHNIKNLINEILEEKLKEILPKKNVFVETDTTNIEEIIEIKRKLDKVNEMNKQIEHDNRELNATLKTRLHDIQNKLNELTESNTCNKDQIRSHINKVNDDIAILKNQIHNRVKSIENNINNNVIKRF